MTIKQMLADLQPVKPLSRFRLHVYLRRFKIKPLGIRQCPQNYPDDAVKKILAKLGLKNAKPPRTNGTKPTPRNGNGKR